MDSLKTVTNPKVTVTTGKTDRQTVELTMELGTFERRDLCESYLYSAGLSPGRSTSFFVTSPTPFIISGENHSHFLKDSHFPFLVLGKRKPLRKAAALL